MDSMTLVLVLLSVLVAVVGVFVAATPYFQRKGELFAVTLPAEALDSAEIASMKKRYALIMAAVAVLSLVICLFFALTGASAAFFAAFVFLTLFETVIGFGLMLLFRRKALALKSERGWETNPAQASAVVCEDGSIIPRGVSIWWNLLHLPIIAVTIAIIAAAYPSMPDMVPTHIGFDGVVNGWTQKGLGFFALPVSIEVFLAACMTLSHYMLLRSKRWTDPGAPVTTAWAYGCYLRANTAVLVVTGLLLNAVLGIGMALSFIGVISLPEMTVAVVFVTVILCVASVAVSVYFGQAGSRLLKRVENVSGASEDDACWKLGVFYWNPDDASAVLPERFGFGWTLNWARPVVWAWVVGFALLTVLFVVFCFAFA